MTFDIKPVCCAFWHAIFFLNWAWWGSGVEEHFLFCINHMNYEWLFMLKCLQSLSTIRQCGYFAKYTIFLFEWWLKHDNFQNRTYYDKNRRKFLHCNNEIWATEEKLTAGLSFLLVSPLLNLFLVCLVSKILWVWC